MIGPDFKTPPAPLAEQWQDASNAAIDSSRQEYRTWWEVFDDPVLVQLVETAYRQNLDLLMAGVRVLQARAQLGLAIGELYPQQQLAVGGVSYNRIPGSIPYNIINNTYWQSMLGVQAGWEIDIWGKARRGVQSADQAYLASVAAYDDLLVTLTGDVASTYVQIRTLETRMAIARDNIVKQREAVQIAKNRFEGGVVSKLDVYQAENVLGATEAAIPALRIELQQSKNALSVLLGAPPGGLDEILDGESGIPLAPAQVAVGIPADLLRRRPDIRSAERRLAAQTAEVGVATAALYPSLSLSGSITLQSLTASDVLDGFRTDRLGLSLSVPLFRGGALRQNVRAQNALVDQALAAYEDTVLAAYEEVENALTASTNEQVRHDALQLGVDSARRASELALTQYNSGLVDFQTVLTADRQLISLEDSLAVSDGEMTANLIRLYKALGGGWSAFPKE